MKVCRKEQLHRESDRSVGPIEVLYKGVGKYKSGVQTEMGSFKKGKEQEWERYKDLQGSTITTKRTSQKLILRVSVKNQHL